MKILLHFILITHVSNILGENDTDRQCINEDEERQVRFLEPSNYPFAPICAGEASTFCSEVNSTVDFISDQGTFEFVCGMCVM